MINLSINPRDGSIDIIDDRGSFRSHKINPADIDRILESVKGTYPTKIRLQGIKPEILEVIYKLIQEYEGGK
jgi:hypothetical protein